MQDINQLTVINIPTSTSEGKLSAWKEKVNFFAAESCARMLFVLSPGQESEIPEPILEMRNGRFQGAQAYEQLLRIYSGLESTKFSITTPPAKSITGGRSFRCSDRKKHHI